jgi:hypothetical protein
VIFCTIRVFPSAKHARQVATILSSVRDLVLTRTDCLGAWLDEGAAFREPISYLEQWESEEGLYRHLNSELYARTLVALELSERNPEVQFFTVSDTRGMELIEHVRRSHEPEPEPQPLHQE